MKLSGGNLAYVELKSLDVDVGSLPARRGKKVKNHFLAQNFGRVSISNLIGVNKQAEEL